jgi:hypothetical protein
MKQAALLWTFCCLALMLRIAAADLRGIKNQDYIIGLHTCRGEGEVRNPPLADSRACARAL